MLQASRDAIMASVSFPLAKYTFSTVPTTSKKWEYNHISSPPSLQLHLRSHELSGGYCLEIISGTDKLEIVDLSRLVRLSNSHSQSTQSNSEVSVCVIYHNLNIAFKYPISTIETRRTQLKFLNGEDYLFVIEKLKKLGLPARPHQPSLKPSSVHLQNTSPRPQHDISQTTVPPMTNQINQVRHGPTLDTEVGDKLTYTSLSSSPLHLSSSPVPRASPIPNVGSSVLRGRSDIQSLLPQNSSFVEASATSEDEHQMSGNPYISTVGSASDVDSGTTSRFFHRLPDQLSTRPPLSRSSMQINARQFETLRPSSRVETPPQEMRPPILGHEFETALTAARRVTSNLERPSTAFSTASDNTLIKRYAEMHESFRPTSVQPATNKDNLQSFMPPKRILPFPSLRKKSTLRSNASQTDPSLSEPSKPNTEKKDASKSVSHKIQNPSSSTVADESQNLGSEHSCTSQTSASNPGANNDEITALFVAKLQAAANKIGKNIEKGTELPVPPNLPQKISGQKRMIPTPEVSSPKRQKTMVDQSTQTQTNSGRDHTASLNAPAPVRKSPEYKNQDTQTPSAPSSLFKKHQEVFQKDHYARPATDSLATPDYHALPENERHDLLNKSLLECLDDPNFMKLCKDMDKCWRKAALNPQDN